ncbi:MAG: hypothetical protein KAK00_08355 [Nanoarchaeota archaeon]|nr:hypothetical protein [Nanoarchaeota archaeon]
MIGDKAGIRKPNFFEQVLLVMGVLVIAAGYFFAHLMIVKHGLDSFEASISFLVWFGLVILIILTAVSENSKEELKIIIKQQNDEMRLLREDLRRKR